jgi:hypothetical protein
VECLEEVRLEDFFDFLEVFLERLEFFKDFLDFLEVFLEDRLELRLADTLEDRFLTHCPFTLEFLAEPFLITYPFLYVLRLEQIGIFLF